jgi:hypothetical protein
MMRRKAPTAGPLPDLGREAGPSRWSATASTTRPPGRRAGRRWARPGRPQACALQRREWPRYHWPAGGCSVSSNSTARPRRRRLPHLPQRDSGAGQSHRPRHGRDSIEATVGSSGAPAAGSARWTSKCSNAGLDIGPLPRPRERVAALDAGARVQSTPCKSDTRCTRLDTDLPRTHGVSLG